MELQDISKLKVAKYKSLRSLLFYTRYFFRAQYKRKFEVSEHHKLICDVLEKVLKGDMTRVIINMPPRFGKTEIAVKSFISHGLALNPSAKFIHLSYSDSLALDNSETVKDLVQSSDYQQFFPNVQIKKDSKAKDKWYTTSGGGVLARSAGGSVTGFGAGKVDSTDTDLDEFLITKKEGFSGAIIVDDPLKPLEADSEVYRERVNQRFESTIRNRVNSRNTPIIIIMQRLHEKDLCGNLMETDGFYTDIDADHDDESWFVLSLKAIKEDGTALWPHKHTLEELAKMEARDPINFSRQYMQSPQPKEGLMYSEFRTYQVIPVTKKAVKKAYIDTADTGTDFLCSITYIETETACYLTDVIYTDAAMETTEPMVTLQLSKEVVQRALFESNNGGRGFARNVETGLRTLKNFSTKVEWFHQSNNKEVRIFTKSADVTNMIYMPEDWKNRWPKFYTAVTTHLKNGKSKHDDGPDVLTGITEDFGKGVFKSNASLLSAFR